MPDEVLAETANKEDPVTDDSEASGAAIAVGCADLPPGLRRGRYFERLDYLENEGIRYQLPKTRVLKRWREEAGEAGRFGLVAPQVITDKPGPHGYPRGGDDLGPEDLAQAGGFAATPVVERAVTALADACAALRADAVVFRSPPDFAPSAANRDAMKRFFADIAPAERLGKTVRVWEPQGLWEPDVASRFAAELGLVYAWDPLSNNPLSEGPDPAALQGSTGYFRISGLGVGRQRFDDYSLEPVIELAESFERAWIVFAHMHKYPDAIRCRRLVDAQT